MGKKKDEILFIKLKASDMVHLVDEVDNLEDLKRITYNLIDQMKEGTYISVLEKKAKSMLANACPEEIKDESELDESELLGE